MSRPLPSLTLVPTPIGNLDDITLRAFTVLREVDFVLAEDTRHAGILLKHHQITVNLKSFHSFNEHKALAGIVDQMKNGQKFALISDAGTPGISDPGFLLVRALLEEGLSVECLPGATAFVPALVVSGLPCDKFVFEGFLPHKKGRQTRLLELKEETRTLVLYESPFRVLKTLEQLIAHLGPDRKASVSREISKLFEETIRGTLEEVKAHFEEHPPKGEFVMVIAGKSE
jgi:16S rRNA (cytidine1402-2'-O)-methyltransferase